MFQPLPSANDPSALIVNFWAPFSPLLRHSYHHRQQLHGFVNHGCVFWWVWFVHFLSSGFRICDFVKYAAMEIAISLPRVSGFLNYPAWLGEEYLASSISTSLRQPARLIKIAVVELAPRAQTKILGVLQWPSQRQ